MHVGAPACLQVAIEQLQSELTASRKEEAALREEAQRVRADACRCGIILVGQQQQQLCPLHLNRKMALHAAVVLTAAETL